MAYRLFEGKKHAALYLKYRVSPSDHLIQQVLGFLEKQKGRPFELAVDVGCGSGQGTLLLAKHFASVVGTDVSPAQLELALQHAQQANITYRQECVWVRRTMPLSSYMGMLESFSSYQILLRDDPQKATDLSQDICQKLMSAMQVTSAEAEVGVAVKYFYLLACKPQDA